MPELIENGYLYIAQPPLFQVTRGKSSVYLKDESALEEHLIESGVGEVVLNLADGDQRAGGDVQKMLETAREVRRLMKPLTQHLPNATVVEQAAIAGALDPEILASPEYAAGAAEYISRRLDALAPPLERGWQGAVEENGALSFMRALRGVSERLVIDQRIINSAEARGLNALRDELQDDYTRHSKLAAKDSEYNITGPISLLEAILEIGRKGLSISRYKGLGEMNPDQLWETTLDMEVRSLLQVRVAQADEAGSIFETLMGDDVEPRRDFIQENALKVANLDV